MFDEAEPSFDCSRNLDYRVQGLAPGGQDCGGLWQDCVLTFGGRCCIIVVDFGLSRGLKGCLIMDNRQIRFVAPGVAEVVPVSVGEPGRGQVLVRICVSSISSGTERANLVGNPNVGITGAGGVHFPRISGYSSAGVVERVGEGVTEFALGALISSNPSPGLYICQGAA